MKTAIFFLIWFVLIGASGIVSKAIGSVIPVAIVLIGGVVFFIIICTILIPREEKKHGPDPETWFGMGP